MFLLVPILLVVAGLGYYKFFLPDGIAAVVNGEEITLSELDAAERVEGTNGDLSGRSRYRLLDQMIAERIMLQEARKAGMSVSKQEIQSALDDARTSAGSDDSVFREKILSQFGSMRAFEEALSRRILMNKFIAKNVVPPGADPRTARFAVDNWYDGASRKAAIRIALAEQGSGCGGGCNGNVGGKLTCRRGNEGGSCCAVGTQTDARRDISGPLNKAEAGQMQAAMNAGLQYWYAKHGPDEVVAKATDFGCHVQVDILKNNTLIGSLRYQNGSVYEL